MTQPGSAPPPEGERRPGIFARLAPKPPATPISPTLESLMSEYQKAVEERIEDGMRQLQQTAVGLMHEIAAEMWRASGTDTSEAQARILNFITRDQAIKGLIAHSDERYQGLVARVNRLEDTLTSLAESSRALKEVMQKGAATLHEAASSPALHGVEAVRTQLEQVEAHIASAFEHISQRDMALLETITARVKENGELVTQETARTVEALQGYVKDGVDSMGRLAQHADEQIDAIREQAGVAVGGMEEQVLRAVESVQDRMALAVESVEGNLSSAVDSVEEHVQSVRGHDEAIAERITRTLTRQMEEVYERLTEGLQSHETWMLRTLDAQNAGFDERLDAYGNRLDERITTHGAGVGERLDDQTEQVRNSVILLANEMNRTIDTRTQGLAQMVRSDSETLRRAFVAATEGHDETLTRTLDERLGQVQEVLDQVTTRMVDEVIHRVGDVRLAVDRNAAHISDTVTSTIDRNMVRLSETLESEVGKVGQSAGQRAAEAADAAVAARLEGALGGATVRLEGAATAMERLETTLGSSIEEARRTAEETKRMAEEAASTAEDAMSRRIDERISALARMIRSDNRVMVERLQQVAEQEPAKHTLRAVKELQANLTSEVMDAIERRLVTFTEQIHRDTQAMAESVAKTTEKLDTAADRVDQRSGAEMQTVIERMGDAMHALASLSKTGPDRIELE